VCFYSADETTCYMEPCFFQIVFSFHSNCVTYDVCHNDITHEMTILVKEILR